MPCKQNKSYKTKLNQCYPINPSLRNFYKTIHGLCLYGCYWAKQITKTPAKVILRCLRYARRVIDSTCIARRAIDSTCISNNELSSRYNIVSQRILALTNNWWRKASDNNHDIVYFTYHHQTNTNTKTPLNIIKSNRFP